MDLEKFNDLQDEYKQKWQAIETAPKDGTDILGIDGRGRMHVVYWKDRYTMWQINSTDGKSHSREIEYWMPLPKPPVNNGNEE